MIQTKPTSCATPNKTRKLCQSLDISTTKLKLSFPLLMGNCTKANLVSLIAGLTYEMYLEVRML